MPATEELPIIQALRLAAMEPDPRGDRLVFYEGASMLVREPWGWAEEDDPFEHKSGVMKLPRYRGGVVIVEAS